MNEWAHQGEKYENNNNWDVGKNMRQIGKKSVVSDYEK